MNRKRNQWCNRTHGLFGGALAPLHWHGPDPAPARPTVGPKGAAGNSGVIS